MSEKNMINNWEKWYPKRIKRNIILEKKEKKSDYTALYQSYYEQGFKLGIKEGYKLKLKKKEFKIYIEKCKLQNKMKNCLQSLIASFQNLDTLVVEQLLQIVLKISSKIFNNSVRMNELKIIKTIKMMISKTILSKKIIFRMNKNDKQIFKNYFGKLLSSYDYLIFCDNNIQPGECILELENEILDSTAYTKWKELCRLFCDK